eukprot:TRINITY_DN362_c1_g4_i2.p1 TRINITY_DN362_c1_g4~~TRINITY_DN362_c1_g4_i2.p1  ORF type:complete len:326 (+),score=124.24 TRINITY_DN362_c1_g4_i2:303-1280(+)
MSVEQQQEAAAAGEAEEARREQPPYKERPEWADVSPVPIRDATFSPICSIAYTPKFKEVMGYFNAVLLKDERSERALALTADVIDLNSANYTAWYYRRLVLDALKKDLYEEFKYTEVIAEDNPKNYQLWYHRRALVERLKDPSLEFDFVDRMLAEDSKNYHAWAHRQWVCESFKRWDGELDFVEKMLQLDLRNNSAWNHRFFVVSSTEQFTAEVIAREVAYAQRYIARAPNNQSPWNFLRGVVREYGGSTKVPELKQYCRTAMEQYPTCAHAVSMLADILAEEGGDSLKEVPELYVKLRDAVDPCRKRYWEYRLQLAAPKAEAAQ